MMNEHPYFHWDLLRQPLQTPQFGMAPSFFDVNSMLELRKEKSRDAARSRRGKENYEFYELARLLPLPAAITSQLDKASIIRLTISYLKLRDFSCHADPLWTPDSRDINGKVMPNHRQLDLLDPFETRQGTHILQSLDGFAFILASDGRFLYISETVSIYLGLSQVEMAGSSIFDYVHHEDHSELAEHLGMCLVSGSASRSPDSGSDGTSSPSLRPRSPPDKGFVMVHDSDRSLHRSFSIRMKSTLTKRGMHVKTSGYRVVHIVGSFRPQSAFGLAPQSGGQGTGSCANGTGQTNNVHMIGLVGMAIALPPPTITELRLELDTFILRLSPDFKVTYCDPIVSDLLNLAPEDVNDRLLYDLCHAADLQRLRQSHADILSKGQVLTDYYRLMTRHGGYVWVQTCASTLFNSKNSDDQSILAINYVLSDLKDRSCTLDLWQMTGDVKSSMSSSSNCPIRDKMLAGLHLDKENKAVGKTSKPTSAKSSTRNTSFGENLDERQDNDGEEINDKIDDNFPSSQKIIKMLFQENTDGATATDLPSAGTSDLKNKRRKMENPRKRRKSDPESQDDTCPRKVLTLAPAEAAPASIGSNQFSSQGQMKSRQSNVVEDHTELVSLNAESPSPEDLSVKKIRKNQTAGVPMTSHQSAGHAVEDRAGPQCHEKSLVIHSSSPPNAIPRTGCSVQDLEAAMSRHLPHDPQEEDTPRQAGEISGESVMSKSHPMSSAPLTPQTVNSWSTSQKGLEMDSNTSLTASNFLKSLYATRESVIKTGSRSQSQSYLNVETPSSLLTPPEPDPDSLPFRDHNSMYPYGIKHAVTFQTHVSTTEAAPYNKDSMYDPARDPIYKENHIKDQFPFIPYKDHFSTAYIDHISSSTYKDHFTSPYKDFPQFKDIVPAFSIPNLMSPNTRIPQAYPNLPHPFPVSVPSQHVEACSITPPASNSPDLIKTNLSQSYDLVPNCQSDNANFYNVSNKQFGHIHLHSSSSPTNGYHSRYSKAHQQYTVGRNGQDLSKSGYYAMGSSPVGSMYTDLTHNATGQYDACSRSAALPWY